VASKIVLPQRFDHQSWEIFKTNIGGKINSSFNARNTYYASKTMICCLNPSCQNPPCVDGAKFCTNCGTALLILENRYQPLKSIGRGGFGKTYLAADIKKFAEQCVIKQFAPRSGDDSETEKNRFQAEAKQLQRLGEHPQIPALMAFFTEGSYLYFVQQYVDGKNLAEEVDEHGLYDETKVRDFLQDLLGILQVVHEQGIVHRDIKPYNIMRRQSDQKLVLIDFGISKQVEVNAATGTSIGSLGYSPLEQVWGGKAYPASDLYSLGVTAFYLMSGIPPHQILVRLMEETSPEQAHNWVKQWRNYIQHPVSDKLGLVLDKLLQVDHKQRYQSATEVLQALGYQQQSQPAATAAPTQKLSTSYGVNNVVSWRTIMLFSGGSLGLIGVLLVVMLAINPGKSSIEPVTNNAVSQDLGDRPENAVAYLERGKTHAAADKLQAALSDFNRSIQLQPKMAESHNERSQVRSRLKDYQGALTDINEALRLRPNWADAYYQRASVQDDLDNVPQAIADLNKSLSIEANNSLALIHRGNLYLKQNNKLQALQDFNAGIKLDSQSSYGYMSRASLFNTTNKKNQAIADYDQAIKIDPENIYYHHQRGILHQETNNKAKAKADFQRTLELAKQAGKEQEYTDASVRLKQVQ
jgi:serine/threonine protein kinase